MTNLMRKRIVPHVDITETRAILCRHTRRKLFKIYWKHTWCTLYKYHLGKFNYVTNGSESFGLDYRANDRLKIFHLCRKKINDFFFHLYKNTPKYNMYNEHIIYMHKCTHSTPLYADLLGAVDGGTCR